QARRTQKYHHVKRVLLDPRLIEEKQIARFGFTPIAAHKHAVEIFQRAAVGKFRESAIAQVAFVKRSEVGAENLFVKRIVIEIKTCDVGGDRFVTAAHSLKPGAIVATQRFAHRESNQTGTVALLRFPLIAEQIELSLG